MYTLLKIPFDKCIVDKSRRGASEAPDIIQRATNLKNTKWIDIAVSDDFEETQNNILKTASEEYEKGNIVVGIGGDHSVTYGLTKAFSRKFKRGGLIILDAHIDCESYSMPPDHEDILQAIVKEKLFRYIFLAGVRNYTREQFSFVVSHINWDSAQVSIDAIKKHITDETLNKVDDIYLSIDIDVFDPKFAPGTGYPEPNGPAPEGIFQILKLIKESGKLRGLDIVEVCPRKDVNGKTVELAILIINNIIEQN